jgi:hypothetical protein
VSAEQKDYVLLRPAHRELALLAVCLRIISTAGFAMAEVLFFGVTRILGGAAYLKAFSPDPLNTLAVLSIIPGPADARRRRRAGAHAVVARQGGGRPEVAGGTAG